MWHGCGMELGGSKRRIEESCRQAGTTR
jgi:hypothetical protein